MPLDTTTKRCRDNKISEEPLSVTCANPQMGESKMRKKTARRGFEMKVTCYVTCLEPVCTVNLHAILAKLWWLAEVTAAMSTHRNSSAPH